MSKNRKRENILHPLDIYMKLRKANTLETAILVPYNIQQYLAQKYKHHSLVGDQWWAHRSSIVADDLVDDDLASYCVHCIPRTLSKRKDLWGTILRQERKKERERNRVDGEKERERVPAWVRRRDNPAPVLRVDQVEK